jgi:hypothetical protein
MQRTSIWLALFVLGYGLRSASAQSPPPDDSPSFYSGEWAGTGDLGSYCYVKLSVDGSGWVLVDAGAGDWSGAKVQWQNRQQSVQIDQIVPLRASAERRLMPLERFELRSEINQSLSLTWTTPGGTCHLQRIETTAGRLSRARSAIIDLPPGAGAQ